MKVTLKWLNDFVKIELPLEEICRKLTTAGLEVAAIESIGGWKNVVVGQIKAVNPHPNADRLRLATVDLGSREQTVVCGAPNLQAGDKIAFASVDAELIDGRSGQKVVLKPAKIRGVSSEGMVCSEMELGLSQNHEGILVLPADAPLGMELSSYMGDTILDIEVTPNRPDCLSVMGIAREIAAQTGSRVDVNEPVYEESGNPVDSYISIEIRDAEYCPRYCASLLTGIKLGPSPDWMQQRLQACGMRPINNVVDITNYVMLEYGQPLHAFDYETLQGRRIIVRRAGSGESIVTLDGVARTLRDDMLVIADEGRTLAVAGIMGGEGSEISDKTVSILIESANFNQAVIHRGSLALKLSSEASLRFDKGLSRELPLFALRRATQLMQEIAGGRVARGIIDVYPGRQEPKPISLAAGEVKRLLGMDVPLQGIAYALESLGFEVEADAQKDKMEVGTPWWRTDVSCAADLVEEVARIIGYDNIPMTMLSAALPAGGSPAIIDFRQRVKNILVSCGLQEVLNYSLTSLETLRKLRPDLQYEGAQPLSLDHPMSRELECLRTDLRAGMLSALERNQRFGQKNIRLFEMGRVFHPRAGDLPEEREMLCALISSEQEELFWHDKPGTVDFYVAKGILDTLLGQVGLRADYVNTEDASLEQGNAADVMINSEKIGVTGKIHHMVTQAFDVSGEAFLFELSIDKLFSLCSASYVFQPVTRYPVVTRDLALVVDEGLAYGQIQERISSFKLVSKVSLFDLYRGEQVTAGKKSLAMRVLFQADDHTLTDAEVDRVQKDILDKLVAEFGVALRD